MRILIVDDSAANLAAAKQAVEGFSKLVAGPEILTPKDSFEEATRRHLVKEIIVNSFSEHEFVFTNSAKEAVGMIAEFDAVITDLFFPDEGHADGGELGSVYAKYCSGLTEKCSSFTYLWYDQESYYQGNRQKASERLANVRDLVTDGTIRGPVQRLVDFFEQKGDQKSADEYRERLKNLPAPQFPYGGALMLEAKALGKFHCLVSDIHSHAGDYKEASSAVDGMMLLLPLMEAEIVFEYEAKYDGGEGCLTYLGSKEIHRFGKGKNDPAAWAEAILCVIIQSIYDKLEREYDQKS